ncbi:MAG TPA: hypothetical protein PKI11_17265, partial [Candidatus Hydrogenedentes bacterium]|nr:hypothetical protein [Candidatus Hydrogenedentota bacterium]
DPKELGVDNRAFCAALNAELSTGDAFEPPYEPLNKCGLYQPLTKARYNLSKQYVKAIDPKRFRLPVCEDAHFQSGVCVHHVMLMNTKKEMDQIAEAVRKLVDHKDELKRVKGGAGRRYRPLAI